MFFLMNKSNFWRVVYKKCSRFYSQTTTKHVNIENIRNLGILAHIDAGKTTTTERMLYYSGLIKHMGEVHHGNTVTDYMEQERERGITITSAAVTFHWKNTRFNLIDTPGHIDFTMEVEQTLRALDGAVVILDGSAGVEAQTLTVWRQADKYQIPRIAFVNKMDKKDASLTMTCNSIEKKLELPCLNLQLPVYENDKFAGLIDVLTLELIRYDNLKQQKIQLTEKNNPQYWNEAKSARSKLINDLTDFDDELANIVIANNSLDDIKTIDIIKSLRTITYYQRAIPVLLGSSYKNIGVQPLMDGIILYLPSPDEKNEIFRNFNENLCARAFKVVHDRQKGALVFFRIYNGSLRKSQRIYSMNENFSEQIKNLYVAFADDFEEVDVIDNGNIAVVSGLKKINSGDLVTNSNAAKQSTMKTMMKNLKLDESEVEKLLGINTSTPQPVFFCAIEPATLSAQPALEKALAQLQREDPSLRVEFNEENGQTILGGMGELHIEIIKDRIVKNYKLDVDLGPLQVAYKESPIETVTDTIDFETKIGNLKQVITAKMSLIPSDNNEKLNIVTLDKNPEYASNTSAIIPKHLLAIKQGVKVGLMQGPKVGCEVMNVEIVLHFFEVGKGTSDTVIAATITQFVKKLLKESGTNILEPIMYLEITSPEDYLTPILADLSKRRCVIDIITVRGNNKVVAVKVPLAELMGYSTILRSLTSGMGSFTMEFNSYEKMSADEEFRAVRSIRGF